MIDRSEERIKQTGEVFTPLELVDEILDKFPQELFQDPKKTFLDPACGDGNFLVRVVAYKIENGSTIKQALRTTYGVDIMPDNVRHCRERLLQLADDHDTTIHGIKHARKKYGKIIEGHKNKKGEQVYGTIVCADSLNEWDFENWKPIKTQQDIVEDLFEF